MTCEFNWQVSWYYTMTPQCGNCSLGVLADCRLPGCVPGDGVKRPVLVVGSLPGEAIEVQYLLKSEELDCNMSYIRFCPIELFEIKVAEKQRKYVIFIAQHQKYFFFSRKHAGA